MAEVRVLGSAAEGGRDASLFVVLSVGGRVNAANAAKQLVFSNLQKTRLSPPQKS